LSSEPIEAKAWYVVPNAPIDHKNVESVIVNDSCKFILQSFVGSQVPMILGGAELTPSEATIVASLGVITAFVHDVNAMHITIIIFLIWLVNYVCEVKKYH